MKGSRSSDGDPDSRYRDLYQVQGWEKEVGDEVKVVRRKGVRQNGQGQRRVKKKRRKQKRESKT